ncbi:dipeptide ABC transporter ATP-binding protein [Streptomyces cylindrosporus]|uniref:ABC transporter ATP-binding protein n=1 Tax=Streptomyces cylindrosporus TaxID=2927583 RepID=A0ABS9YIL8_9ACTN|nr:ABC transporter ATP-binding protein [Streptomyces cylindrosporus]MCI3275701.1 ABC transporter ATP-binding protein [Streptomyces cylindrosporus]
MTSSGEVLLDVRGLWVERPATRRSPALSLVRGVDLVLRRGEVLGLVGESGAGKSLTALALLGLTPPGLRVSGSVRLHGRELVGLPGRELARVRGRHIALVFQDALAAFTPVVRVGDQIGEVLRIHRRPRPGRESALRAAVELLDAVGVPEPGRAARSYPHELSGGMRQRAMIAMAMAGRPDVIVADEPTSALDVTVQAQVLEALRAARLATGAALLLVSHDLGVVAGEADRVAVMYGGRIVESAGVDALYGAARMPYTKGLIGSVPRIDRETPPTPVPGSPPAAGWPGPGCAFAARCPLAEEACGVREPELDGADGHLTACHRAEEAVKLSAEELFPPSGGGAPRPEGREGGGPPHGRGTDGEGPPYGCDAGGEGLAGGQNAGTQTPTERRNLGTQGPAEGRNAGTQGPAEGRNAGAQRPTEGRNPGTHDPAGGQNPGTQTPTERRNPGTQEPAEGQGAGAQGVAGGQKSGRVKGAQARGADVVLRVSGLARSFPVPGGRGRWAGLGRSGRVGSVREVWGVERVDLEVRRGETLGLVGESGAGKSSVLSQVVSLDAPQFGSVEVLGQDVARLGRHEVRRLRGAVQFVPQDPMSSLDPRMRVGDIVAEPLWVQKVPRARVAERVGEVLRLVGLDEGDAAGYPHEFSGGQRQRIAIARALAVRPQLLLLDEPVSALDVSVGAGILDLLRRLKEDPGPACLFVSHDLAVVRQIADRVAVMYAGRIVETGEVPEVFALPGHPYTRALLDAVPVPDPAMVRGRPRVILRGEPQSPGADLTGCRFRTRCPVFMSLRQRQRMRCEREIPEALTTAVGGGRSVACHFPLTGGGFSSSHR